MLSRRTFLKQTTAGALAATSGQLTPSAEDIGKGSAGRMSAAAHRSTARIKSVVHREETVRRFSGVGDNWHMSWAADDRQYVSLCDGYGFSGQTQFVYNCRMLAIEGRPQDARFHDLSGYPQLAYYPSQKLADARYYPFGTLALDGRLYQFMSTFNRGLIPEDIGAVGKNPSRNVGPLRFIGAKLIYSPDNGRTWRNQDGSTPVVWESWDRRSRDTMVFFEEPQEAFSLTTVLQMGRNYKLNRDGYVYVYGPNGNTDGTMNELVMFRVPKKQILSRGEYEYFAGLQSSGGARWDKDIGERKPVHSFPRGWVNTQLHPYAWHPSVVYYPPLRVYIMANWGMGTGPDGSWFAKPSYLGFWTAPNPWGPWTQIHEEATWMPAGEKEARAYEPQIAPKWIAPDGRSFWLVWTDGQMKGDKAEYDRMKAPIDKKSFDDFTPANWALKYELFRRFNPYYSFNLQRVDLVF